MLLCFLVAQDPFEQISLLGSREGMISPFIKSEQLLLRNIEFLLKMDDAIEFPFINELFFVDCCCHCVWILRHTNFKIILLRSTSGADKGCPGSLGEVFFLLQLCPSPRGWEGSQASVRIIVLCAVWTDVCWRPLNCFLCHKHKHNHPFTTTVCTA